MICDDENPDIDECEGYVMPFGKHKGEMLGDIVRGNITYLDWLNGLDNTRQPLKRYVEVLCEHYANEIEAAISERDFNR